VPQVSGAFDFVTVGSRRSGAVGFAARTGHLLTAGQPPILARDQGPRALALLGAYEPRAVHTVT
jgi:hypothetical protein